MTLDEEKTIFSLFEILCNRIIPMVCIFAGSLGAIIACYLVSVFQTNFSYISVIISIIAIGANCVSCFYLLIYFKISNSLMDDVKFILLKEAK